MLLNRCYLYLKKKKTYSNGLKSTGIGFQKRRNLYWYF